MRSLVALSRKYNGRISALAGPLAEAQGWIEMERAREQGLEELSGCGFLTGCGGVFSQMAVLANGTMVACASLPDLALGRINRDDLADIWQNHPELNRFRKRREIPLSSFEFCAGCPYIPYCTGNCPGTSYTITHDAWAPSPDACYRLFLEQGGKLPPFEDLPGSSRGGGCCDE
jgi:SynChlorMet cassette radical SAM/SPASM protein ScmE